VRKNIVGVPVNETKREAINVVKIVIGMRDIALPITHGSIISGMNTTTVVAVHEIREFLYVFTDSSAACNGEYHCFIFSLAPCIITVAVSTAIQRQIINEKFVKTFMVYPIALRTKKVTKNAIGIDIVARKDSIAHTKHHTIKKTTRSVEIILTTRSL
jgi:hypothetical protein